MTKTALTVANEKLCYTAPELSELLDISVGQSYKIIRQLNQELEKAGYLTLQGKVSRRYFEKRWYGAEEVVELARKSGKRKMEVIE